MNQLNQQPGLRPVPMTVFPTMGSLQEVIDLANAQLPISDPNVLFSLLATYHNTLLKELHVPANHRSHTPCDEHLRHQRG